MTDLEALVVAAYVFADEFPAPVRPGRRALVSDAELVALAVCQAAMGICLIVRELAFQPAGDLLGRPVLLELGCDQAAQGGIAGQLADLRPLALAQARLSASPAR